MFKTCSVGSDCSDSQELISCSQGSSFSNSGASEVKHEIAKIKRHYASSNVEALKLFFIQNNLVFPDSLNLPVDLTVRILYTFNKFWNLLIKVNSRLVNSSVTAILGIFHQVLHFLALDSDVLSRYAHWFGRDLSIIRTRGSIYKYRFYCIDGISLHCIILYHFAKYWIS